MKLTPRSLVGRMALTTALTAVTASSVVATVSVVLANRFTDLREDAHLREATDIVVWEFEEDGDLDNAAHEMEELEQAGISSAIFEHGKFVNGDRKVAPQAADTCRDVGSFRACARSAGAYTIVASRDATPMRERAQAAILSAFIAVALTGLLGTLASFGVARAVVKPLSRLRTRVEQVPEEDPGSADLGESDGVIEIDALRTSLNEAFSRLGAALLQSRRFARDAAHQLRTPLTAMLGEVDLALERAPPDLQPELTRVRRLAVRLAGLIDRLLIIARPQSAAEAPEEVELLDVITDAVDAFPPALRARVVSEATSLQLLGDHSLLVAMLSNALDNALKYSEGRVSIMSERRAATAVITVQDQGPGIPRAERERVFEPFYRTPLSRASDIPGNGIGLALIAHVVRLHGGKARFVDGPGAQLELELPIG